MNQKNCVILIMAKFPEAGKVKTRLQPVLTPNESADLAMCFLQDTVNKALNVSENVLISYTPEEKCSDFVNLLSDNLIFKAQEGDDLGEKLSNAFEVAFDLKFEKIVVIGTDSPTLPADFITNSFETLHNFDVVIGETLDGGFYLIGMKRFVPKIFEKVEWSSSKTFSQTLRNIEKLGLSVFQLPVLYDVDTAEDIERLLKDQSLEKTSPITFKHLSTKK